MIDYIGTTESLIKGFNVTDVALDQLGFQSFHCLTINMDQTSGGATFIN